jgi:hypothetical protein
MLFLYCVCLVVLCLSWETLAICNCNLLVVIYPCDRHLHRPVFTSQVQDRAGLRPVDLRNLAYLPRRTVYRILHRWTSGVKVVLQVLLPNLAEFTQIGSLECAMQMLFGIELAPAGTHRSQSTPRQVSRVFNFHRASVNPVIAPKASDWKWLCCQFANEPRSRWPNAFSVRF